MVNVMFVKAAKQGKNGRKSTALKSFIQNLRTKAMGAHDIRGEKESKG
jgi:hypothetical protein